MDTPEQFETAEGYACYGPVGVISLQKAVNLVSLAITYARERQIKKLFIDTRGLTGFDPPTTLELFTLGGQFARAARGAVKVAFVARPELIDPPKFGLTVARNRGMIGEVFTTEAEALAWLLGGA
jgi:hypothetical protein